MTQLIKKYLHGFALVAAILAPIMMCIEVVMDLMQPQLLENIIDIGIANGDLDYVYATGVKMILAALMGLFGGAMCSVFASIASTNMATGLRQGLFNHVQTFSFLEIDRFQTSSLITRLTNDVMQVQNMLEMVLRGAVRSPLLCIGGIVMAVIASPRLAFIFWIAIPLILIAAILILRASFPLFTVVQEKIDAINTLMRESILGVRIIKALSIEHIQGRKFDKGNQNLKNISIRAQNMNMVLWPMVTLVLNLSIVGVLWFGGNMVIGGDLQVGKIMAFINYLIQIMNSLIMAVSLVLNLSRAKASADRINEVMVTESSIQNPSMQQELKHYDIEFEHVSFRYHQESEDVLKDISLTIKEGQKVGIIGSTGAGKSSFIHLIPRLYDATQGKVKIGGRDVRHLSVEDLREHIGVVLQDNTLFSGTIEENMLFGKEDATDMEIQEAARIAQALEFIDDKEESFKSMVEQRGKNFSGGQKQRLSIARTLVRNPKILIMDDATSALDVETEHKLQEEIKKRMDHSTILLIAQRVSAIMDADKIIVLDHGKIEAVGKHHELLKTSKTYRTIATSQLGQEVLLDA